MRYIVAKGAAGSTIVAALLLSVAACGGESGNAAEAAPEQAVVVELGASDVAVATRTDLAAGVVLTGSLMPYRAVPVKAQVSGTVSDVRVDRGTPVRKGQVLATIDADGIRTQAAAAKANLALAEQRLESARVLHEAGAMSDLDYSSARAAYEAARAQAAAAAEQAVRTTIVAPIDGVVSERHVAGGEAVNSGHELFTVVNTQRLELAGQIPIEAAGRIRPGMPVVFTLDAEPGRELRGTVDRIEPVADLQTRQVGVYVQLPNPGGKVVAGQFATGRIVGDRIEDALVVPEVAVRDGGSGAYVLVVENGRIVRRAVETGIRDVLAGVVSILSGVNEGEQVVAAPAAELEPGTPVRVSGAADATARKAATPEEG
ncbi:MAG TPA: efflux RND transporter periplasmic adaptor subunit [Longimicrobiales bacterium]